MLEAEVCGVAVGLVGVCREDHTTLVVRHNVRVVLMDESAHPVGEAVSLCEAAAALERTAEVVAVVAHGEYGHHWGERSIRHARPIHNMVAMVSGPLIAFPFRTDWTLRGKSQKRMFYTLWP